MHNRKFLPQLADRQRRDLAAMLEKGTTLDADFYMTMVLSTGLACLGLLQDSTPVIIGAMIVAPLMWPLLTAGLGLVQADARLFGKGLTTAATGLLIGLSISLLVGFANPGFEPTIEVEARGTPDLLDMGIAFLSGLAAAYAVSRAEVFNIIAGVAIAAALVPPLSVVGIAFASGSTLIAANACILLATNVVAIIIGAATIFWSMGARLRTANSGMPPWERLAMMLLSLALVLLVAVLLLQTLHKQRMGPNRPLTYPVSPAVRDAVNAYVSRQPDMEIIMMGRQSVEPETGITVLLASSAAVPENFADELADAVRKARREPITVRVFVLQSSLHIFTRPQSGLDAFQQVIGSK